MTWTAPEIDRPRPVVVAREREMLQSWLDNQRQTLLMKCTGLTAEQLRSRSAEPSTLSLLGLVRHMSDVERAWFRKRAAGQEIDWLYYTEADEDADFNDIADADAQQAFDTLLAEIKLCDEAVADLPLEHTFAYPRAGKDISLRWVYVHMIEEYARHNGHADILRERIDGVTGY